MRFLALFLFVLLTFGNVLAQHNDVNADYYIMSDYELNLDPYADFDVMGGEAMLQSYQPTLPAYNTLPTTLPVQTAPVTTTTLPIQQNQPITLPIQQATQQLITLPVQTSKAQAINLQPHVKHQMISQPITQYRYIEQPIIQPRLIEQPKLQQRIISQPVYRQIVTQPVIVPQVTTQPIINQRVIEQPIIQHRLIENTVVQPHLIEVPVTNKAQMQQAIQLEAQPILNRQPSVTAQPIMRQAPTLTQAPVTAPMVGKGGLSSAAVYGNLPNAPLSGFNAPSGYSQAPVLSGQAGPVFGQNPNMGAGDFSDMGAGSQFGGASR